MPEKIAYLARPNPDLLQPYLGGTKDAGGVARTLLGIGLNKPVVNLVEEGTASNSQESAWGFTGTSKAVFNLLEAASLGGYIASREDEFLAAFERSWTTSTGRVVSVRAASRWLICGRVLADLRAAILAVKGAADPFVGMPWIEVMRMLGAPILFKPAADLSREALKAKPAQVLGKAVRGWSGEGRSGMDAAMAEACQVKDIVPASDRALLVPGEEEMRLDDLDARRLLQVLRGVVEAHPLQAGPILEELARAVGDFGVPESGVISMRALKAQTAWMRGLAPCAIKYRPCAVCGFPAFHEKDEKASSGRQEEGWMVGSILGGGWQPGTLDAGTVYVPVCLPCRAEKIVAEQGLRRFGQHPILLTNLGETPIPMALVEQLYNETWTSRPSGEDESGGATLAPGAKVTFGNISDRQRDVKTAPNVAYFRTKLTYAYLALRSRGYDVALDFPGAHHPVGIFGWSPSGDEAGPEALHQARMRLCIARLVFIGNAEFERKVAKNRALTTVPWDILVRTLIDAVREMLNDPRLNRSIKEIFEINGGKPMRFKNIDILEEAVAWSEVVYPFFAGKRDIYSKSACTKALSEAVDNMLRASQEERLGVAMAALARNLSPYLNAEDRAKVPAVMADLQARLEKYVQLSQVDLCALRNLLDPLIKAAIKRGVRYTPGQNNFCTLYRRRLNEPDEAAVNMDPEPEPATEEAAVEKA